MITKDCSKNLPNNGEPYCEKLPYLEPPTFTVSEPKSRAQKLYCWFYYLELIQKDPSLVLDNLDKIPTFRANWSQFEAKKKDKSKTYKTRLVKLSKAL
jgi:hypothetical protein